MLIRPDTNHLAPKSLRPGYLVPYSRTRNITFWSLLTDSKIGGEVTGAKRLGGETTGYPKAPSTRIRIFLKAEIFSSVLAFRSYVIHAKNPDFQKTVSRVKIFENAGLSFTCGRTKTVNKLNPRADAEIWTRATLVGGERFHHCASHPCSPSILGYNEVPQETWSNSFPKTVPPCNSTKLRLSFKRRHEMGSVTHKFSLHLTILLFN